jgi:hypothetical protein
MGELEAVFVKWKDIASRKFTGTKFAPEGANLEKQILAKNQEIETKEQQIEQLKAKLPPTQPS